ncbi:MAG TPA: LysR family transcriptional regulator [Spirochaetales bacterium]|nr:LysR family transcriptional regulator [Spirochaetales bacterium]
MLYLLQQFIAVAESGSYTKAADIVHISQPAITKNIKKLESEFGGQLIERSTHGCSLTDLGKILYTHAKNIQNEMELLYSNMTKARSCKPKHFTLAYGMLWQILYAAKILISIEKMVGDKLIITGKSGSTEEMIEALCSGECDLFIGRIPQDLDARLIGEPLLQTHHAIFAYKEHYLLKTATIKNCIPPQELLKFPWLILGSKEDLSGYEIPALLKHNIEIKPIHDNDSFYIILQILQKSEYLIILPHQVGKSLKAYGIQELKHHNLDFEVFNSGFIYRKELQHDENLNLIRSIAKKLINETR